MTEGAASAPVLIGPGTNVVAASRQTAVEPTRLHRAVRKGSVPIFLVVLRPYSSGGAPSALGWWGSVPPPAVSGPKGRWMVAGGGAKRSPRSRGVPDRKPRGGAGRIPRELRRSFGAARKGDQGSGGWRPRPLSHVPSGRTAHEVGWRNRIPVVQDATEGQTWLLRFATQPTAPVFGWQGPATPTAAPPAAWSPAWPAEVQACA